MESLEIDRWGDVTLCLDMDCQDNPCRVPLGNIDGRKPPDLGDELDREWDRLRAEWIDDMDRAAEEMSQLECSYREQQGF